MSLLTWSIGLHLSPKGYELMYREFKAVVESNWPELVPDKLESVLPVWNQFPESWNGPPQKR
jgi:hypothetical protein